MARTRRYIGSICGGSRSEALIDISDYVYSIGDVVKNTNNDCFTIIIVDDGSAEFEAMFIETVLYTTSFFGHGATEIIEEYRDCDECNGIYTITYSDSNKGWTSFWSYKPDWMIYLNNSFYSFDGQALYKHNTNSTRNNFYGTQYTSQLSVLMNQTPDTIKMYNTIELDSTSTWDTYLRSDLNQGVVDSTYYVNKEDQYFAYIRRPDNGDYDLKSLSTQGIGGLLSISSPVATVLTFGFNISTSLSVGDTLYKASSPSLQKIGTILSYTKTTITLTSASLITLTPGDLIVCVKNAQAESYGIRGYYMQVDLENDSTEYVEIFSVNSSTFKSYGD